jgi:hypothetical protein
MISAAIAADRHAIATRTDRPSVAPACATNSGDGVSPAARAIAKWIAPRQRRCDCQRRCWPLLRVEVETPPNDPPYRRIYLCIAVVEYRTLPGEQLVEDDSKSIDIAPQRNLFA